MKKKKGRQIEQSTRYNMKWILGALALLVIAYATGSGFVVYSLYAILFVMVLSRLITEVCLRGIEFERELGRMETTIGEKVELVLTIRNKGFLPIPWVFVEDLIPARMPVTGAHVRLMTLMPGQEEKLLYQVAMNRRGYHQIGPALMEAGDLFGFFRRYKTGVEREYVMVYPSVEQIMEYDIASRRPIGEVKVTNRIFEDPTRIIGVREYQPGDPFNRIHWKTAARTGALYSKVFEPSRVIGATIILDMHENSYRGLDGKERGELAIVAAASLADYVSEANEQVGLMSNGRDLADVAKWEARAEQGKIREQIIKLSKRREKSDRLAPVLVPTRKSAEQGLLILETLARVDYTDGLTIDKTLEYLIQQIGRDSTLLLVTAAVTEDLSVTLNIMKEAGYLINVFIIDNEPGYFEAIDWLAPYSIDVYHVKDRGAISKYATQDIYY